MIQNITLEQKSALSRIMKVIWKHKNSVLCFRALQNNKVKGAVDSDGGRSVYFPYITTNLLKKIGRTAAPKNPTKSTKPW